MQTTQIKVKTRTLSKALWEQVPARYGLEAVLGWESMDAPPTGNLKLRHSFPDGSKILGKVADKQGHWWLLCEYHSQLFKVPYGIDRKIPADVLWNWEADQGITQIYI